MSMSNLGVSVTQALIRREGVSRISTSSERLNDAFWGRQDQSGAEGRMGGGGSGSSSGGGTCGIGGGGIARGTVGEITGPPGVGKTTLALQVAVNAAKNDESVIWIDTSTIFPLPRFRTLLSAQLPEDLVDSCLAQIHSVSARSLPLLLTLLSHYAQDQKSVFASAPNLSLVVIDDLSTPILATYPSGYDEDTTKTKSNRNVITDSLNVKRTNVLKELGHKLASLAIKRNIAIVVLNQLNTKVTTGNNASLVPALGDAWTSICSFRVTLYRQRVLPTFCSCPQDVRFAYFQKVEGIVVKDEDAKNVPFLITDSGIEDVVFPKDAIGKKRELPQHNGDHIPPKRRRVLSFVNETVDDSEGEDDAFPIDTHVSPLTDVNNT